MLRRTAFGLLWFVAIYLGSCMLLGAIAGAFAGADDPQHAYRAGQIAGGLVVAKWRHYLFVGAVVLAVAGATKGWLPGTKSRKPISKVGA